LGKPIDQLLKNWFDIRKLRFGHDPDGIHRFSAVECDGLQNSGNEKESRFKEDNVKKLYLVGVMLSIQGRMTIEQVTLLMKGERWLKSEMLSLASKN
jgi:hypothetical protein